MVLEKRFHGKNIRVGIKTFGFWCVCFFPLRYDSFIDRETAERSDVTCLRYHSLKDNRLGNCKPWPFIYFKVGVHLVPGGSLHRRQVPPGPSHALTSGLGGRLQPPCFLRAPQAQVKGADTDSEMHVRGTGAPFLSSRTLVCRTVSQSHLALLVHQCISAQPFRAPCAGRLVDLYGNSWLVSVADRCGTRGFEF